MKTKFPLLLISLTFGFALFGGAEAGERRGDGPSPWLEQRQAAEEARKRAEAESAVAAAAAAKRRQEESARLATIQEATRLREEAQQYLDEAADEKRQVRAGREELAAAKAVIESQRLQYATASTTLENDKRTLQSDKEKLEFRQAVFSTSVVGLLLTNLFTLYQLATGRQNRKLQDEKVKLEIELLREKLRDSNSAFGSDSPPHPMA